MRYRFFHIRLLFKSLLLMLILFSLTRLLFFLFNYSSFGNDTASHIYTAFFHGIRFDLSSALYLNILYVLLTMLSAFLKESKTLKIFQAWSFYIPNAIGLLLNLIDIEYYKFQRKRTTIELFSGENDIIKHLPEYIKSYGYLLLIFIALLVLMVIMYKRLHKTDPKEKESYIVLKSISFILLLGLVIIGVRGGLQTKPIQMITASYYGNPQNAALVLNTPFTVLQSLGKKTLEEKNFFDEDILNTIFSVDREYDADYLFRKKNIVVIILESFSNEYIGTLNKGKGYAPFMDSLMQESLYFTNAFANGKKSNEAMPSIFASIPSLMEEAYTGSVYQDNQLRSFAHILKEEGYNTAFFHGGINGTMNFDAFAKKAGFDQYYGMNEYPDLKDYDGNWGIYDDAFFNFFGRKLSNTKQPFLGALFSLSSHPPYAVPDSFKQAVKDIKDEKLRSFRYTDYALARFFDYAKTKRWYSNTVFVITADHTPDAMDPLYGTPVNDYRVPLFIFDPSGDLKMKSEQIVQQIDIMPSVLDYLNYSKPFKAFGESVFTEKKVNASVNFRNGIYQLVDPGYFLQFSDDQAIALYDYLSDPFLKDNLLEAESDKKEELEKIIKAYIQTYNNTLIHNTYK